MEDEFKFNWNYLGDVKLGRENLGENMPVFVYRLFEYTMRESISNKFGNEASVELLRDAGKIAGANLYKHFLSDIKDESECLAAFQKLLADTKIGILRVESIDDDGRIVVTVSEDLDCSGLPVTGETVCFYDEGFIAGVLSGLYKKEYTAEEIDCWAKGDRVCRFVAKVKDPE